MHIGVHVTSLPTPVFIDRLISGLVEQGHQVSVFGVTIKSYKKISGVDYVGYKLYSSFNVSKLWVWLKFSVILSLFRCKEKKRLNDLLALQKASNIRHEQAGAYPILYKNPDILHVQWVKGVEKFEWVQEFGIKLATSLRGSHISMTPFTEPQIKLSYQRIFPKLDGVHSVCKYLIEEATSFGLNEANASTIYLGVNIDDYKFVPYSSSGKSKTIKLISVGRKSWIKGYHIALDACAILKAQDVKFKYTIVGFEKDEELLFMAHQSGMENEVSFEKWMSQTELKKTIQDSDILLLPSLTEGIANVAIEAMALGTMVIASNCGGMNELIQNNNNGFLHATRNKNELAEKIIEISKLSVSKHEIILKNARETVERQFNSNKNIKDFERFYKKMLDSA